MGTDRSHQAEGAAEQHEGKGQQDDVDLEEQRQVPVLRFKENHALRVDSHPHEETPATKPYISVTYQLHLDSHPHEETPATKPYISVTYQLHLVSHPHEQTPATNPAISADAAR